jgi:prepilin-type N-terminal cleavage/methylation domain-containing protein
MRAGPTVSARGFTLLEAMIALVILGLVGTASLALFGAASRSAGRAEEWARGVAYAEAAMEEAKLDWDDAAERARARAGGVPEPLTAVPSAVGPGRTDSLPGGFSRTVDVAGRAPGLRLIVVTVGMPSGARFRLSRLVPAFDPAPGGSVP